MATRNCRRTGEEKAVHDEAVRLRRMTDAQLVEAAGRHGDKDKVAALLSALSDGECKGIKGATVYKIQQFALEKGYMA